MKRILLAMLVLLLIAAVAVGGFAFWPTQTRKITQDDSANKTEVGAGRYVAVLADCAACHTAPGGKSFAGGLPITTPIGTVYTTNITPDLETGIGRYTLDDFDRAVRHGIARDGSTLYPAMPYPSYAKLTDADLTALYAYFMHGVDAVRQSKRAADIPFPLSMRWPLAIWRKLFVPASDGPFDASRYDDPMIARGAYLVQGPGHCGACHTPRAITFQEKGLDDSSPAYLSGAQVIDGWIAPNLRGNEGDGLGRWSAADIIDVLQTGRSAVHAVFGPPMSDVIIHSTQHMKSNDLKAIVAYLKTLQPTPGNGASYAAESSTAEALAMGRENSLGAQLYIDNCAACHLTNGKGPGGTFPALTGNAAVLQPAPTSIIRIVLNGAAMPATKTRPSDLGMPGFAWRLSDDQVAQLITFVRTSWGNTAPSVTPSDVAAVRATLKTSDAPR